MYYSSIPHHDGTGFEARGKNEAEQAAEKSILAVMWPTYGARSALERGGSSHRFFVVVINTTDACWELGANLVSSGSATSQKSCEGNAIAAATAVRHVSAVAGLGAAWYL